MSQEKCTRAWMKSDAPVTCPVLSAACTYHQPPSAAAITATTTACRHATTASNATTPSVTGRKNAFVSNPAPSKVPIPTPRHLPGVISSHHTRPMINRHNVSFVTRANSSKNCGNISGQASGTHNAEAPRRRKTPCVASAPMANPANAMIQFTSRNTKKCSGQLRPAAARYTGRIRTKNKGGCCAS